jgi:hypothetical protein
LLFKFSTQLSMIVDFTIVDETVPPPAIPKGLVAAWVEVQE